MLTNNKPINFSGQTPSDFIRTSLIVQVERGSVCLFSFTDDSCSYFEEHRYTPQSFETLMLDIANQGFGSVRFVIDNPYFALFPNEFFDSANINLHGKTLFGDTPLIFNSVPVSHNRSFIYGCDEGIDSNLMKSFPKSDRIPLAAIFLQNVENQFSNPTSQVHLEIRDGFFNIIVFQDGKLQLINSYQFNSISQFGFYCLGVINNFKLSDARLLISGRIDNEAPVLKLLQRYIADIEVVDKETIGTWAGFHQQILRFFSK